MSRRFLQPLVLKVADLVTQKVLRSHQDCIRELQDVPILRGKLIRGIVLEDGVETIVAHGLGHKAILFMGIPSQENVSATDGRILDLTAIRTSKVDPSTHSVLKATDFTATLTIDVWAI